MTDELPHPANTNMIGFIYTPHADHLIFVPIVDWEIRRNPAGASYGHPIFPVPETDFVVFGVFFDGFYFCSQGVFTDMRDWAARMSDQAHPLHSLDPLSTQH